MAKVFHLSQIWMFYTGVHLSLELISAFILCVPQEFLEEVKDKEEDMAAIVKTTDSFKDDAQVYLCRLRMKKRKKQIH